MSEDKKIRIDIEMDGGDYISTTDEIVGKSQEATGAVEELGASMDSTGARAEASAERIGLVGDAYRKQTDSLRELVAVSQEWDTAQNTMAAAQNHQFEDRLSQLSVEQQVLKSTHMSTIHNIDERIAAERTAHDSIMRGLESEMVALGQNDQKAAADVQRRINEEQRMHDANIGNLQKQRSEQNKYFRVAMQDKQTESAVVRAQQKEQRDAQRQIAQAERTAQKEKQDAQRQIAQAERTAQKEKQDAQRQIAQAEKAAQKEAADREKERLRIEKEKTKELQRQNAERAKAFEQKWDTSGAKLPGSSSQFAAREGVGITPELAAIHEQTKATQNLHKIQASGRDAELNHLANTRYALYDIASTWKMIGAASGAAFAGLVAVSEEFESAFVHVQRTVEFATSSAVDLKQEFLDLASTIPETFVDLSEIGTIGGQLDIAGENIVSFTENVAKFSAMTDATIENTSMSFGRIDQLANQGAGSFDNIASSVYSVGVNTVATEEQILKMTQELSASAATAGFTAQEVIGLSGALASLGAAPERSRGAMERTFAIISNAVSMGGDELLKFAKVSGMSADEFALAWKTAPNEAFQAMLHGMSTAENLNMVLEDLGLNQLRTADVFKRLAGNMEIVDGAMEVSSDAWLDHAEFLDAYGMVADTLGAKLKMLGNDILEMIDTLGDTSVLGSAVDQLRNIASVVKEVLHFLDEIPVVGKGIGVLVPTILGVVTAYSAFQAIQLTLKASIYAMITATDNMNKSAGNASITNEGWISTFRRLRAAMKGEEYESKKIAASRLHVSSATQAAVIKNDELAASMARVGASTKIVLATPIEGKLLNVSRTASYAALHIERATKALWSFIGGAKGLAGLAVMGGIAIIGHQMQKARMEADELRQSFSGLSDAIMQDTRIYEETGEALRTYTMSKEGVILAIDDERTAQGLLLDAYRNITEGTSLAKEAVEEYTIALGKNTERAIINSILNNEKFMESLKAIEPIMDELGISLEDMGRAFTDPFSGEGAQIIEDFRQKFRDMNEEAFEYAQGGVVRSIEGQKELGEATTMVEEMLRYATEEFERANFITDMFGLTAQDTSYDVEDLENSVQNLADTVFNSTNAEMAFEDAMYNLGAAMETSGNSFDIYTQEGRASMKALEQVVSSATTAAGEDVNKLASYLAGALQMMRDAGATIPAGFEDGLQKILNQLAADTNKVAPIIGTVSSSVGRVSSEAGRASKALKDMGRSGRNAGRSAGGAAKDAAKEIRTLTDYVKDLSSVMKSAFDFRWGLQKSVDGVADAVQRLQDMKTDAVERLADAFDAFDDSKQRIVDLRTEIASLQADLNSMGAEQKTLEYQLKVAQDYGDTLREQEILAQMQKLKEDVAKTENDLTKTSTDLERAHLDQNKAAKELSDAQRDVERTLSGTTASSREQRAAVLSLVESYQAQVAELANSNLSHQQLQAEVEKLRQKFIQQMVQLGYSRAEADKYSQSFVDMKKVIDQIPRNITISANANPAQRAIDEFRARNTGGRGASAPINMPVTSSFNDAGVRKAARAASLSAAIEGLRRDHARTGSTYVKGLLDQMVRKLNSGNYYVGGFTGRGGKYEPAGTVHKGEYVFPKHQVDQSTGLPYLSALGEIMEGAKGSGGGGAPTSAASTLVVELSPTDRKLIRDSGNAVVTLDGKVLASAVNGRNANTSRRGA